MKLPTKKADSNSTISIETVIEDSRDSSNNELEYKEECDSDKFADIHAQKRSAVTELVNLIQGCVCITAVKTSNVFYLCLLDVKF